MDTSGERCGAGSLGLVSIFKVVVRSDSANRKSVVCKSVDTSGERL